ncbi:MAG: hypothetical protein ACTHJJ_13340 [Intrasporangium sp.]|uniref:hypothetical protein n=1 Tax=Intrasporangium sp. TaxID=1925024 RepID=UPI003F80E616
MSPFRLGVGDAAPVQQSATTCGSACLTVARMLANPSFADWIVHGDLGQTSTANERFAAYEQVVAGRTNGVIGPGGRLQPPWPRALGTPPWGARHEIEFGASRPGTRYAVGWVRLSGIPALGQAYDDLHRRLDEGRPALLYIGNAWLPRHVVLAMPGATCIDVYEPSTGRVVGLPRQTFVTRRVALAGWDVPWCIVGPR